MEETLRDIHRTRRGECFHRLNPPNGGASGGYWLADFNGETGLVNGHNSFTLDSSPGYMFSPYYGMSKRNFYNEVKDRTPL